MKITRTMEAALREAYLFPGCILSPQSEAPLKSNRINMRTAYALERRGLVSIGARMRFGVKCTCLDLTPEGKKFYEEG